MHVLLICRHRYIGSSKPYLISIKYLSIAPQLLSRPSRSEPQYLPLFDRDQLPDGRLRLRISLMSLYSHLANAAVAFAQPARFLELAGRALPYFLCLTTVSFAA